MLINKEAPYQPPIFNCPIFNCQLETCCSAEAGLMNWCSRRGSRCRAEALQAPVALEAELAGSPLSFIDL